MDADTTTDIDLFGFHLGPPTSARCAAALRFESGLHSATGSAPAALRVATGERFTARAAAVSGFAVPGAEALFSLRVTMPGLSSTDILTVPEPYSPSYSVALSTGGTANARKLAQALRAGAGAIDALCADIESGAARPCANPASAPAKPSDESIGLAEVMRLSGLSRQSVHREWARRKKLVPPTYIDRRPTWLRSVIRDWLATRT